MRWFLLLFLFSFSLAFAGEISTNRKSTAIKGYDSVAYHAENAKPTKGNKEFTYKWKGAKWQFVSQEMRDAFAENPESYAPKYGGHCANAMSINKKVRSNPKIWTIVEDKLYLFAAKSGLKRWKNSDNVTSLIAKADENWLKLKDK